MGRLPNASQPICRWSKLFRQSGPSLSQHVNSCLYGTKQECCVVSEGAKVAIMDGMWSHVFFFYRYPSSTLNMEAIRSLKLSYFTAKLDSVTSKLAAISKCIFLCVERENQLDVTECFIALMICSSSFGQFYAHHQELETICVLLPPMVCSAWLLVVGGQVQGSRLASRKRNVAASLFLDA